LVSMAGRKIPILWGTGARSFSLTGALVFGQRAPFSCSRQHRHDHFVERDTFTLSAAAKALVDG
jgi:hypothetical protein